MEWAVAVQCARVYAAASAAALAAAAVGAQLRDQSLPLWALLQHPLCLWALVNALCCVWLCGVVLAARWLLGGWSRAEGARVGRALGEWGWGRALLLAPLPPPRRLLLALGWSALLAAPTGLLMLAADRVQQLVESVVEEEGVSAERRAAGRAGALAAGGGALLLVTTLWALQWLPHDLAPATLPTVLLECGIVVLSGLQVCHRGCGAGGGLARALWLGGGALLLELVLALQAGGTASGGAGALGALALLLRARHSAVTLRALLAKQLAHDTILNTIVTCYPRVCVGETLGGVVCAICWGALPGARRLPCGHMFHAPCLARWAVRAAQCPTCRRALPAPAPAACPRSVPLIALDGARYAGWLPSFTVEVTWSRVLQAGADVDPAPHVADTPAPAALLEDDSDSSEWSAEADVDHAMSPAPPRPAAPAEARLSSPPPAAAPTPPRSASPPAGPDARRQSDVEVLEGGGAGAGAGGVFGAAAGERQCLLAARKRALLRAARQRYLLRHQS